MLARKEQPQAAAATVKLEVGLSGLDLGMHPITNAKPSSKNKRRFNEEQIKSLEFMFESDSRPESQIKQHLANELGLQPRQIAIWFQNRRARTKSKQLERDYNILKQSYDGLSSSYESLKRDNQSLRIQLQKMKSQLDMQHANETYGPKRTGTSEDGKAENRSAAFEPTQKINFPYEGCDDGTLSSNKNSIKVESTNEDGVVGDMIEATDGSLTTSKKWCSFESNCFLDESSCSSNWWEYW